MLETIARAIGCGNSKREFRSAIARRMVSGMEMSKKRVDKLRDLVGQCDSIAAFARQYGLDATYISQLLNGHRAFGEKAARNMEGKMRLAPNYFDAEPGQSAPTVEEWRAFSNEELAEIAQAVLAELSRRAVK